MSEPTINSNIGVNINPNGLSAGAGKVREEILKVVKAIEAAGDSASKQVANMNQQAKMLSASMKNLQTLANYNAKNMLGNFGDLQTIGRQARALGEFRVGMQKTSDSAGVLRNRLKQVEIGFGELARQGRLPTKKSLLNAESLEQTSKAYGGLLNTTQKLRARIAGLGDDARKSFAPMLESIDKIDSKNQKLFAQENRFGYRPQLDQMERLVGDLSKQVGLAEQSQKAERLKLETLRQQGLQILNNNRLQRETALASKVRSAETQFRNRDLLGKPDFNRNISQSNRLERATNAVRVAKARLNVELSKPSEAQNAEAISKLTAQYDRLVAAQGRAIAASIRLANEQSKSAKKAERQIEPLRQQGLQILNNDRVQQDAALASKVRSAETQFRNRDLLGKPDFNRNISQSNRLERATNAVRVAKARLNVELSKPVEAQNAAAISKLTAQYDRLVAAQGRAIAASIRLADEQSKSAKKAGGFFGGLKTAPGNLLSEEGGGMFGAGQLVGRVASYAVAAGAIYTLISSIQQGISFAIEFEDSLAQLQAVSGATGVEMARLSDNILEVARNSATSVMELTKSATIIAQAGYAGSEIPDLLESVVNLADASGSSTDESVDILTSSLGSFQLAASESSRVTDVLVNTLNRSKLSVNQVQLGLQYVGAAAKQNNISLEELTATLGTMADAGIRSGSTMSTGLRQMLVDFIDPSKKLVGNLEKVGLTTKDIDVKTLGLVEVLDRLRNAGFQAYGSLETRAAAAYQVLANNADGINELMEAAQVSGAAEEAQQSRLDSLSAKWQQIKSSVAAFGAELGNALLPILKATADGVLLLFDSIADFNSQVQRAVDSLGEFGDYMTPNNALIVDLSNNSRSAADDMASLAKAIDENNIGMDDAEKLTKLMSGSIEELETASNDTKAEIDSLETQLRSLEGEAVRLVSRKEDLIGKTRETGIEINSLSSRFPGLREEFNKTEGGISGLIKSLMALDGQLRRTLQNKLNFEMATLQLRKDKLVGNIRDNAYSSAGSFRAEDSFLTRDLTGRSAYRNKDLRKAFEYASSTDPKLRPLGIEMWNRLPQSVRQRTGRDLQQFFRDQAERSVLDDQMGSLRTRMDANSYFASDVGQGYSRNAIMLEGMAGRAASQGSANGMSRQEIAGLINEDISRLTRNLGVEGIREGTRRAVEEQIISLKGALGILNNSYQEDTEGGRRGSGRRSGSRDTSARDARRSARIDEQIAKEERDFIKAAYDNLFNQIKDYDTDQGLDGLDDIYVELSNKLEDFLESEKNLALQQIEKNAPNQQQKIKMLEFAGLKAEELRKEEVQKLAQAFESVIKKFISVTVEAIERQAEMASRFTQRNLQIAQARLESLNNPLNSNNTPEYMRTLAQRNVDIAESRDNLASIDIQKTKLAQLIDLIAKAREQERLLESDLAALMSEADRGSFTENEIIVNASRIDESKKGLINIRQEVEKLEDQAYATGVSLDVMLAKTANPTLPTNIGEATRMAIQAINLEINAADSFGQEFIKNIDGPLRSVHEGFKGFFRDMISGSQSMGDAFQTMAGRIIDSILEMVAVALANQFFTMLGSMFAPGIGGPTNLLANTPYGYRGGQISELPKHTGFGYKGMYNGGSIGGGLPTRDSTLIHAAKEEYLIRRPAAMSLGKGFLDAINARGANALQGMGQNVIAMPQVDSRPVNVYVIAPEEKPTMGPDDVIATISQDVLKGGTTKKLIKQVASNG